MGAITSDNTHGNTLSSGAETPDQGRFLRVFTAEGSFDAPLAIGTWTVGRASTADIRIDDPSMSRAHARLRIGEHVALEDLGSVNGTRVGGRPIAPGQSVLIAGGTPIEFGNVLSVLRLGHERAPAMRSAGETGASPDGSNKDRVLHRIAQVELPVLIEGETGTGKSYTVQRLHALSRRAAGPLVQVPCALVRAGRLDLTDCFERAASGSLVLDEITNLDPDGQALLVAAWESSLERFGAGSAPRVVSMSLTHVEDVVAVGAFRPDLYYRLAHLTLQIPPLRARQDELPELATALLEELARAAQSTAPLLSPDAMRALQRYPWPGNVRELRIALERARVLSNARVLTASHFAELAVRPPLPSRPMVPVATAAPVAQMTPSAGIRAADPAPAWSSTDDSGNESLREAAERAEIQRITEALRACNGNQTRAAKLLGISRGTLVTRLRRYDMPRPRK